MSTLYGIGLGPGDSELVTIKAARRIAACPVIAYPVTGGDQSFARAIAAPYLPPACIEVAIPIPVTDACPSGASYDAAAVVIAGHLDEGRDVGLLCQGDPLFYGSFLYLFDRLRARFPVEIIPGVGAIAACAAAAKLPLLARRDSLVVLPAMLDDAELAAKLMQSDTAAIFKLGRHSARICRLLARLGLAERSWYIERASLPEQFVCRLDALGERAIPYFAMVLVHRRGGCCEVAG